MSIIMQPAEMQKMQSIQGGPIKGDQVYQQALVLLKNIIKSYWENPNPTSSNVNPSQDKENISLNANQNF